MELLAQPLSSARRRSSPSSRPWSPAVFSPRSTAEFLPDWLTGHIAELQSAVRSRGAALLRGFALVDPEEFAAVATRIGGPLGVNYEGPSPRKILAPGVYSASEVWAPLVVAEHAEMSYLAEMPRHLFFWCRTAAASGGATTLADGRRVLARLDPEVLAALTKAPLRVRRRHARPHGPHDPFELKRWPALFGSDDAEESVRRAEALGYRARIERDGSMTLEHDQTIVRKHPVTGERAFLSHLLVFHASSTVSTLASAYRREGRRVPGALAAFAQAYRSLAGQLRFDVASDVTFANGKPISDGMVAAVRDAVEAETYALSWQRGDLVVVDNHLVLHGRRPFRGPRDVVVAWSDARA